MAGFIGHLVAGAPGISDTEMAQLLAQFSATFGTKFATIAAVRELSQHAATVSHRLCDTLSRDPVCRQLQLQEQLYAVLHGVACSNPPSPISPTVALIPQPQRVAPLPHNIPMGGGVAPNNPPNLLSEL